MNMPVKVVLSDDEIPRQWYNIQADLPHPLPPPVNKDGKPIGPDDLAPVFPMNLIEQEVSTQRWIDIPEAVLEKLLVYRPSPLCRATAFEQALKTPAKIYYKNEGVSPAGSHKTNTALAQAYYNKAFGFGPLGKSECIMINAGSIPDKKSVKLGQPVHIILIDDFHVEAGFLPCAYKLLYGFFI